LRGHLYIGTYLAPIEHKGNIPENFSSNVLLIVFNPKETHLLNSISLVQAQNWQVDLV
jgi:hypothetical protein